MKDLPYHLKVRQIVYFKILHNTTILDRYNEWRKNRT